MGILGSWGYLGGLVGVLGVLGSQDTSGLKAGCIAEAIYYLSVY